MTKLSPTFGEYEMIGASLMLAPSVPVALCEPEVTRSPKRPALAETLKLLVMLVTSINMTGSL